MRISWFSPLYLLIVRLHRLALDARRHERTWRFFLFSAFAGVLAGLLIALSAIATLVLFQIGFWPLALLVIAFSALPPLQPLLQRHVLAPLGMVRSGFWLAHIITMADSDAYALVCAAWAHARKPASANEAWIIARRDKRTPLGDTEIIVTALLAAARGDADTARQLMRSTAEMVENHPLVRELVGEWLAVDAAEREAWNELAADAAAARWPASSLTFFLEGLATRRTGAKGAPRVGELWLRWLLAPHRHITRRLFAAPPAPVIVIEPARVVEIDGALPRAVATHLAIIERPVTGDRLAQAVAAWDAALLDGETQKWLARRALELDAPLGAVDRAIREVAVAVTDELARIAERTTLAAPSSQGPVGESLARRLRHGRLDAVEAGFTRWEDRRHSGTHRAPIDEWREWVALRAAYDAAIATGGPELRRLAFPHAYAKGTSMAVWLWNGRSEYALSHAISRWLLSEALAVGDTEAIDLCTRNCRLMVPTRTGNYQRP